LKILYSFSGGHFAEFVFVSRRYTGSWYAAIIKALLAQRIVKNRRFIFPAFGTLGFLGRITA